MNDMCPQSSQPESVLMISEAFRQISTCSFAILLQLAIFAFAGVYSTPSVGGQFDGDADRVIRLLQITANEMNKSLPTMIDSDTRFDRVGTGPGRRITYVRTLVNYTANEMPARMLENLIGESIHNGVCSAPEMQIWLNDDVTIVYRYSDRHGNYIHQFIVNRESCRR